jgi:hypothetical protein
MRYALTTRIYNSRAQQSASLAVFQAVNGCAAQHWGQLLTFQGKSCSLFGSFTNKSEKWTKETAPGRSPSSAVSSIGEAGLGPRICTTSQTQCSASPACCQTRSKLMIACT